MVRLIRFAVLGVVAVGLAAPATAGASDRRLAESLGDLWTTVLELPEAQNPFTSDNYCVELAHGRAGRPVVTPFAPFGVTSVTCTVKPGTRLFITAYSSECSTIEPPPYFGEDEPSLRACASAADALITTTEMTLDGKPASLTETETALLHIVLPEGNIFGLPAGTTAQSVGHGWVAALHPLRRGTHTITLHTEGVDVFGNAVNFTNKTTIIVTPRREP